MRRTSSITFAEQLKRYQKCVKGKWAIWDVSLNSEMKYYCGKSKRWTFEYFFMDNTGRQAGFQKSSPVQNNKDSVWGSLSAGKAKKRIVHNAM